MSARHKFVKHPTKIPGFSFLILIQTSGVAGIRSYNKKQNCLKGGDSCGS